MRGGLALSCVALAAAFGGSPAAARAQQVPLEYRVKAAYLYNFTKFVEWPAGAFAAGTPLSLCVAERNPFGSVLADTLRGEEVQGRQVAARVVDEPGAPCHVLFIPDGVAPARWLVAARTQPVLTVGESDDFLGQGGMVRFILEENRIRFEIRQDNAERAQLRISSRLLRLGRAPGPNSERPDPAEPPRADRGVRNAERETQ